jgi:hypothetical protein
MGALIFWFTPYPHPTPNFYTIPFVLTKQQKVEFDPRAGPPLRIFMGPTEI